MPYSFGWTYRDGGGYFTEHLDHYTDGVPFLDEAKAKSARSNPEIAMKMDGIMLSDGHYRLVKDAAKIRNITAKSNHEMALKMDGIMLSDGHYWLVKDA